MPIIKFQNAMTLLTTCESYIPNLKWEWYKESLSCIGYSSDGYIQANVFTDNYFVRIALSTVEDDNATVFISVIGEITKLDELFQELYIKLDKFHSQLTQVFSNRPNHLFPKQNT